MQSFRRRPLHPPLVHTPIGAVVTAAALDTISIAGKHHSWAHDLYRAATLVLMVGTAVLFLAVIAGLIDRSRGTSPRTRPRRAVNQHATVMLGLGAVCVVELVLRRQHYGAAQGHTPAAMFGLSVFALLVAMLGGELGGRLVYAGRIGVEGPAGGSNTGVATGPAVAEEPARARS